MRSTKKPVPHGVRPKIGVTGPAHGSRILWWFTCKAVQLCGGNPLRLRAGTLPDHLCDCDGFVLMGGGDINPQRYGESTVLPAKQYDLARDDMELRVIHHALDRRIPLLGICRGMQLLNVAQGGSLHQDASKVLEDFLPHESLLSKCIGRRDVSLDPQSRLYAILGGYRHYRVNSIHHQAVNRLGEGLWVVAKEENGLVQAVEAQEQLAHPFLIGVQWHPELMLHASSSRRLFKALVDASR